MLHTPLDDHAFQTLTALAAAEEGFYILLSDRSRARAASEGWTTPHGLLTELGHALLLAESGRRATKVTV